MSKTPLLDDLYGAIASEMGRVDEEIETALHTDWPAVADMVEHLGRYAGKRLRPALVFITARAAQGSNGGARGEGNPHCRLAAVVEMIHLATLVHDDVIDGASMRRRQATVNVRWDNYEAVLLGDIVFARAINLLAKIGNTRALLRLTRAVSSLCEGEILQNRHRHDAKLDEESYYEIIDAKTAALYSAGCELSAHLAGASDEVCEAFATYGRELGLAFQIIDDCLDVAGDEEEVGKSLGTDLGQGKMTLPFILARDALAGEKRDLFERVFSGSGSDEEAIQLAELLQEVGTLDEASKRAETHVARALEAIRGVLEPDACAPLEAVAAFVLRRCL